MTQTSIFTILSIVCFVGLAHAKAHDQGKADGTQPVPPGAAAGAVDDGQKNGQRGQAARAAKADNRVEPVSRPGRNK